MTDQHLEMNGDAVKSIALDGYHSTMDTIHTFNSKHRTQEYILHQVHGLEWIAYSAPSSRRLSQAAKTSLRLLAEGISNPVKIMLTTQTAS